MPSRALFIEVRLLDGRYHGAGGWPPSPFRLFQALVAGAYGGRWVSEPAEAKDAAFRWLERLDPPHIAAPASLEARATTYFVPNNDLDAVGGDPRRVSEIRVGKTIRPILFDAVEPILYAWPFDAGEDHARTLCAMVERLHTLGWGIDAAFATAKIVDWSDAERRLCEHARSVARPGASGDARAPACPVEGSLGSLKVRYGAGVRRFEPRKEGRSTVTLFRQPPKPQFRTVAYNRAPVRLLYALVPADGASGFHPIAQERAGDIAKAVRDRAAARLRGELRDRAAEIERVIVGRDAGPAELERRVRFLPLPSIGMAHTDPAIRRIVVEVPPDCPIDADTLGWAISGQSPGIDPQTGEVVARWLENAVLAPAADDRMLSHFGFGRAARRWQSVTPVALPPGRRRGRLKGSERAEDEQRAAAAVATALRHAGHAWRGVDIRVQAEPFFAKGARAEAFEPADADMRGRFAGRLSHVEVTFPEPVAGPLVIGDGRFLGLGLMAPVREGPPSLHLFSVDPAIAPLASAGEAVARALRRAVMARADAQWRSRYAGGRGGEALPLLFTGHEPDGQPARSGRHEHLFFLAEDADGDGRIDRLAVIAPHRVDRSPESDPEKQRELARHLRLLDRALAGLALLRAGRAGVLRLSRIADTPGDQDGVFGRARVWVSRTPYRLTRHPRRTSVEEAVRLDILQECSRRGLPRPAVDVLDIDVGPQERAAARVRLHFRTAVEGPLLLGRGSHFGAGEFAWQE